MVGDPENGQLEARAAIHSPSGALHVRNRPAAARTIHSRTQHSILSVKMYFNQGQNGITSIRDTANYGAKAPARLLPMSPMKCIR
jgi:hypothetical protein